MWCMERLLIVFLSFFHIVASFNIDVDYPVKKQGKPMTYFGFAVAEHQVTVSGKVENW